jgi:hypothetical protein
MRRMFCVERRCAGHERGHSADEPLFQPLQEGLALVRGGQRVEPICQGAERLDRLLRVRSLGRHLGEKHGAFVGVLCAPLGEVGNESFDSRLGRREPVGLNAKLRLKPLDVGFEGGDMPFEGARDWRFCLAQFSCAASPPAGPRGTRNAWTHGPTPMSGVVQVFGRRRRQDFPHAQPAGVQKASRHEVAGGRAQAEQRVL